MLQKKYSNSHNLFLPFIFLSIIHQFKEYFSQATNIIWNNRTASQTEERKNLSSASSFYIYIKRIKKKEEKEERKEEKKEKKEPKKTIVIHHCHGYHRSKLKAAFTLHPHRNSSPPPTPKRLIYYGPCTLFSSHS